MSPGHHHQHKVQRPRVEREQAVRHEQPQQGRSRHSLGRIWKRICRSAEKEFEHFVAFC